MSDVVHVQVYAYIILSIHVDVVILLHVVVHVPHAPYSRETTPLSRTTYAVLTCSSGLRMHKEYIK